LSHREDFLEQIIPHLQFVRILVMEPLDGDLTMPLPSHGLQAIVFWSFNNPSATLNRFARGSTQPFDTVKVFVSERFNGVGSADLEEKRLSECGM
jgi:hypothetical protein